MSRYQAMDPHRYAYMIQFIRLHAHVPLEDCPYDVIAFTRDILNYWESQFQTTGITPVNVPSSLVMPLIRHCRQDLSNLNSNWFEARHLARRRNIRIEYGDEVEEEEEEEEQLVCEDIDSDWEENRLT